MEYLTFWCRFKLHRLIFGPTHRDYLLADTVVIFLRGPEANDGVSNRGSVDWREASHSRQDHSVLQAVVAGEKRKDDA